MKIFFVLLLSLFTHKALAVDYSLGTGYSEAFEGQMVPILYGAIIAEDFGFSAWSQGTKNSYYYDNKYLLSLFYSHEMGQLIWGKFRGGIGFGLFFGNSGYKEPGDTRTIKTWDAAFGPMGRVQWNFIPFAFLAVEVFQGIGGTPMLLNSYQNIGTVMVGVEI